MLRGTLDGLMLEWIMTTAEFAVESIKKWWLKMGSSADYSIC